MNFRTILEKYNRKQNKMSQENAISEKRPHPYVPTIEQAGGSQKWNPTFHLRWNMFCGLEQKWVRLYPYTEEWRPITITWENQ